jgi:hypothetical protein
MVERLSETFFFQRGERDAAEKARNLGVSFTQNQP